MNVMSRRGGYGYFRACERCHCALDPGEGRFCEDCENEIREEERYAKEWGVPVADARRILNTNVLRLNIKCG